MSRFLKVMKYKKVGGKEYFDDGDIVYINVDNIISFQEVESAFTNYYFRNFFDNLTGSNARAKVVKIVCNDHFVYYYPSTIKEFCVEENSDLNVIKNRWQILDL